MTEAVAPPDVALKSLDLSGFPEDLLAVLHVNVEAIQNSQAAQTLRTSMADSDVIVHDTYLYLDFLGLGLDEIQSLTLGLRKWPPQLTTPIADGEPELTPHTLLRVSLREPFDTTSLTQESGWVPVELSNVIVYRSVTGPESGSQFLWFRDSGTLFVGAEAEIQLAISRKSESPRQFEVFNSEAHVLFAVLPKGELLPAETVDSIDSESLRSLLTPFQNATRKFAVSGEFSDVFRAELECLFETAETTTIAEGKLTRQLAQLREQLEHPAESLDFFRPFLSALLEHLTLSQDREALRAKLELPPEFAAKMAGQLPWLAFLNRTSFSDQQAPSRTNSIEALSAQAQDADEFATPVEGLAARGAILRESVFSLLPDFPVEADRLTFYLILTGDQAADIVAFRPPQVTNVTTESGRLKRALHPDAIPSNAGLCQVDAPLGQRDLPVDSVVIPVAFHLPVEPPRWISELAGECVIQIAGEQLEKTIPDLRRSAINGIQDPDLLAAGVRISREEIAFDEPLPVYVVEVGNRAGLRDVKVTNMDGTANTDTWVGSEERSDGGRRFLIGAVEGELPAGAGLRLTLLRELHEETLTWTFRDLPIPPGETTKADVPHWVSALNQADFPQGVFVDAQLRWCRFMTYSPGGERQPRRLEAAIDVTGSGIGLPVACSPVEVTRAQTNGVRWQVETPASRFPGGGHDLVPYDPLGLTGEIPPDGMQLICTFAAMQEFPRQLDRLHVGFTVLTCDSRLSIQIENVMSSLDHPLEHPKLTEKGIRLTPRRNGRQVALIFEGETPFAIHDIEPLTIEGNDRDDLYSGRNVFGGITQFLLVAEQELPEILPVRIVLNENLRQLRLEGVFADLPVPPRPTESP